MASGKRRDAFMSAPTALLVAAGFFGCGGDDARVDDPVPADGPIRPTADHHLHIRSAAGAAMTDELSREPGSPGEPSGPSRAADAIAAMDSAGVEYGFILSIAYMYGMPYIEVADEHAKVRAENDYVAEQVSAYPDRLVGACSVNPLADYALEEIERCGAEERLSALKLHFTNSGVDLRNSAHVERLQLVFRSLRRLDLPAIVHMRTREEGYGVRDANIFVDDVLSQAPGLPVQIAHMAGWGGYDDATDEALGVFADAFDAGRLNRDDYSFGLGAVVFNPAAAGADTSLARGVAEANQKLAARIRQIGLDRVVFATDWPSWPPVEDKRTGIYRNILLMERALPLTENERRRLFSNVGSVLDRAR